MYPSWCFTSSEGRWSAELLAFSPMNVHVSTCQRMCAHRYTHASPAAFHGRRMLPQPRWPRDFHAMRCFLEAVLSKHRKKKYFKSALFPKNAFVHLRGHSSRDAADTLRREARIFWSFTFPTLQAAQSNIPECKKQSSSSWKLSLATFYPFKSIAY